MNEQAQILVFIKKVVFFYLDINESIINNNTSIVSLGATVTEQNIILKQLEATYDVKFSNYTKYSRLSLKDLSQWISMQILAKVQKSKRIKIK